MTEQLVMRGQLEGHSGWVTSLATSLENPNMLLSASRDKTLIIWTLTRDDQQYGYPKRSLHGHSHIVSDCVSSREMIKRIYPSRLMHILRSSLLTAPTPSLHHGTRHSDFGNWQPVPRLAALSATPTTSSLYPSQPTIVKSCPDLVIAQSSCGTP